MINAAQGTHLNTRNSLAYNPLAAPPYSAAMPNTVIMAISMASGTTPVNTALAHNAKACPLNNGLSIPKTFYSTARIIMLSSRYPPSSMSYGVIINAIMTNILFNAAQQTLQQFAKDPRYLNAVPGILSALHTWGRNLSLHPHLHVLLSHGGINKKG